MGVFEHFSTEGAIFSRGLTDRLTMRPFSMIALAPRKLIPEAA